MISGNETEMCILVVDFLESGCKGAHVGDADNVHWVARTDIFVMPAAIRGGAVDSVNRRAVSVISVVGVYSWSR